MDTSVMLLLPDGSSAALGHGDLIGRLETAALHLSDPRISEAHAMVSLRGASLKLVALRGRIAVAGVTVRDVELAPGIAVELAPDFVVHVQDVVMPRAFVGLEVGASGARIVSGVSSLVGDAVRGGHLADARAWFWPEGQTLIVRRPGAPDEVLAPGDTVDIDGVVVHARLIETGRSFDTTMPGLTHGQAPLTITARYTSVHIARADLPTLVVAGLAARVVSDLVQAGVPMPWAALARELWPASTDTELRAKWDMTISRLRKKLVAAGIRADLVRSDGHGNLELCIGAADVVRDES